MDDIYIVTTMFTQIWVDKLTYTNLQEKASLLTEEDSIRWVTIKSVSGSDHSFFLDRSVVLNHSNKVNRSKQVEIVDEYNKEFQVPDWQS